MNTKTFIEIIGMAYVAGAFGYYLTGNLLFFISMLLFPIVFTIDIWVRDEIATFMDKLVHHEIHLPFDKWLHHAR
jgi:hypothetical protein